MQKERSGWRLSPEKMRQELEAKYHITSKQYTEEGMTVKMISDTRPAVPCTQPQITLEDAYLYLMAPKETL